MRSLTAYAALLILTTSTSLAMAQESAGPVSSLARRTMPTEQQMANGQYPADYVPGTNRDMNWFHRELPPPRKIQVHDLIHIRVDERSESGSEGMMDRRKSGVYNATLTDWLRIQNLTSLKPTTQADGDQRVAGNLNKRLRSEGEMETVELLRFTIAAEVQEILPNGTLKLEARKTITVNEEVWVYHLRGTCRVEDVNPNNTILSEHMADLTITKEDQGTVRDSYRRGWLLQLWDRAIWF
ncbi:MAG: flagellar basal body L-ring protein FlgH [Pirellulaceae bacterium]